MFGNEPAKQRPRHTRQHECARHIRLVARALLGRNDVPDDGLRQRDQPAAAEALEGAGDDQDQHAGRERARGRTGDEHADGDQQRDAPANDVAELAVDRRNHGCGEQIGGHHPGQQLIIAELAPDRGQRGRHDGLIERRDQHREQHAEHNQPRLGRRQGCVRRRRGAGTWGVIWVGHIAQVLRHPAAVVARQQGLFSNRTAPRGPCAGP